jgi:hypothetical protein
MGSSFRFESVAWTLPGRPKRHDHRGQSVSGRAQAEHEGLQPGPWEQSCVRSPCAVGAGEGATGLVDRVFRLFIGYKLSVANQGNVPKNDCACDITDPEWGRQYPEPRPSRL